MSLAALRRLAGAAGGATAVEFAIIVGPLLLLTFGSIEFGRLYFLRQALQETATAGARCMGVLQSGCSVEGVYNAALSRSLVRSEARAKGLVLADENIGLDPDATCNGYAGFSRVNLTYTFETSMPRFLAAVAFGPTLNARACFPNQAG